MSSVAHYKNSLFRHVESTMAQYSKQTKSVASVNS